MEFQRQRGVATTIYFPMVKVSSEDLAVTGDWTPATGDTKISKDGGSVANTGSNPTIVAGTGSVLWSLALTATEMDAEEIDIQIVDSATKVVKDNVLVVTTRLGGQLAANGGLIVGEVDTGTFTATTTQLEGIRLAPNLTEEATNDHFNGTLIKFTSGAVRGIISPITDYELANSKEKFTYTAIATAPVATDRYIIL